MPPPPRQSGVPVSGVEVGFEAGGDVDDIEVPSAVSGDFRSDEVGVLINRNTFFFHVGREGSADEDAHCLVAKTRDTCFTAIHLSVFRRWRRVICSGFSDSHWKQALLLPLAVFYGLGGGLLTIPGSVP